MSLRHLTAVALIAAIAAVSTVQAAKVDEDAAVAYRKEIFEAIGAHMHAIVAIVKGEVAHPDHLAVHAQGLALTAPLAKSAFELQTMGKKEETTAVPAIWENWEQFASGMDKLVEESRKFAEVAQGDDMQATGAQLQALGKVCKGCHDNFRDK